MNAPNVTTNGKGKMKIHLKECLFCNTKFPLGYFNKNGNAGEHSKGRWAWCKSCEQIARYYESKGIYKKIVSFSGGKDSTAMLLMMLEKNIKFDEVVYFDAGSWEWPEMAIHIEKVEQYTGIKIKKFSPYPYNFDYMMSKWKPEGKKAYNGWPTPSLRWCTLMKINTIRKYLREYRPYFMYIGFAVDEPERVVKQEKSHHNLIDSKKQINHFPLVEWGMTEQECLDYCIKRGFDWGGLYKTHKRVSCWCCPLQRLGDLRILNKSHPELWEKLKQMNEEVLNCGGDFFRNNPKIFTRIETEVCNG